MIAPAISPERQRLTAEQQKHMRGLLEFIAAELPPVAGLHLTTTRRSLAPYPEAAELNVAIDLQVLPRQVPTDTQASGLTSLARRTGIFDETCTEHIRNALQLLTAFTSSIPERDPHGAYFVVRAVELDALRDRLHAALQAAEGER